MMTSVYSFMKKRDNGYVESWASLQRKNGSRGASMPVSANRNSWDRNVWGIPRSWSFVNCSSATGGNSTCAYALVFSRTEKYLPLNGPLPPADTFLTLPVAQLRAYALPNNLHSVAQTTGESDYLRRNHVTRRSHRWGWKIGEMTWIQEGR
jgi:hypothetical protein